ncbi:AMP-binding protein [Xylophilus sp.]|uniref:AMP-binding protein n=1 Tax=Xylophilus sp. TaxID=2653893 RepID=UPI0013BB79FF|nr:AMP-binding protein [Xylophilus sp.]KAF1050306.1 MAG: Long-chain-fatty-acid--CoA ligase FadD13 [Xylophilus sp.]
MHLSHLFQRTVRMHGSRPALAEGTAPALSYEALDRRVRALARWLREDLRLHPGDRVALAMKNHPAYAEAMLAIWHAELCAVPVNARLHADEIGHVLDDAGARLALSLGEQAAALAATAEARPAVQLVDVLGAEWQQAAQGESAAPDASAEGQGDDLAWLFYTSGTTGRPKGVMLTHANLVAMALNFQADLLAIDATDAIVHAAPLSHGSGLYGIPYWMRGALQIVPVSGGFDEAELAALASHWHRASLFAAPTIINRLVTYLKAHSETAALPGLRCIFAGGAPFYGEDIKAAVATIGPRVALMYGQGESPMTITALRAEPLARAVAEGDDDLLASAGWPQTTVTLAIQAGDGEPAPPGTPGEVLVRSPTVMRGYWNNPGASAQALTGGWLRTGDIGVIDARGLLHLKDRSKDVIISGGSNIYPREVEDALLAHPGVAEVAVVGTPDREWGEAVVAVVVRRPGIAEVDEAALDAVCLERIARFKRPKRYVFVQELPKNATGKVVKRALKESVTRAAGS